MHRDDSLSEMMAGESEPLFTQALGPDLRRGRGLADLKGWPKRVRKARVVGLTGWDPLDRRIEVEKKEKYGQALRDQMAMNSARGPHEQTATSPLPPSRPSSCTRAAGEVIASPHSMMHGSVVTDSSAASKVAQVQELMRQRLQAVQEEQQRQWQEIQLALNSQLQGAQQAAQEAVKRELQEVLQNQQVEVQALRRAMADLMQAQQVQEERYADALQSQLGEARSALQRVEAEAQQQLRSCQQHMEVGHYLHEASRG